MFLHLEIHNENITDLSAPPGLAGLATSKSCPKPRFQGGDASGGDVILTIEGGSCY